jgi:hypothetical protein
MQFRVVIPSNVKEGQTIRIRCPDGAEGDVRVPKGLKSGDSFVFEMPDGDSNALRPSENKGFLDREIVNLQDFATALAVGLFIGVSIISGFILGVLTVTYPSLHASATNPISSHLTQMQQQPQMSVPQTEL